MTADKQTGGKPKKTYQSFSDFQSRFAIGDSTACLNLSETMAMEADSNQPAIQSNLSELCVEITSDAKGTARQALVSGADPFEKLRFERPTASTQAKKSQNEQNNNNQAYNPDNTAHFSTPMVVAGPLGTLNSFTKFPALARQHGSVLPGPSHRWWLVIAVLGSLTQQRRDPSDCHAPVAALSLRCRDVQMPFTIALDDQVLRVNGERLDKGQRHRLCAPVR